MVASEEGRGERNSPIIVPESLSLILCSQSVLVMPATKTKGLVKWTVHDVGSTNQVHILFLYNLFYICDATDLSRNRALLSMNNSKLL